MAQPTAEEIANALTGHRSMLATAEMRANKEWAAFCERCETRWPCDAAILASEIGRLQAALEPFADRWREFASEFPELAESQRTDPLEMAAKAEFFRRAAALLPPATEAARGEGEG